MLQEILLNPQVQIAIAVVIAVIVGVVIKKKVDYNKLLPLIHFIISLIYQAEERMDFGVEKKEMVMNQIERKLPEEDKSRLVKAFGTIGNAVEWTLDRFGQRIFKRIIK